MITIIIIILEAQGADGWKQSWPTEAGGEGPDLSGCEPRDFINLRKATDLCQAHHLLDAEAGASWMKVNRHARCKWRRLKTNFSLHHFVSLKP